MAQPPRTWRTTTGPAMASSPVPSMAGGNPGLEGDERPLDDPDPLGFHDGERGTPPRSPPRTVTSVIASGGDQNGQRKHVDYRMDPAPTWGGDLPERNFKEYHHNLQLWMVEAEARIPPSLIGKRILDSIPLGSKLSALLAHLTVDEITADDGYKTIVGLIEDAHEYLKDQRLEQAFDEAIFRGRRDRGQTLTTFLTAKKASFAELRKQGLDLLATRAGRHLLGHLILRQGSFTQDQRQRLKVVTNGSIDYQEIERAIQKIFGDKLDDGNDGQSTPRRWRSASYWESGYGEDAGYEDDDDDWNYENQTYAAFDDENIDLFEDLLNINDKDEVQMTFMQEIPMVMDEMEALDTIGGNLEEIYYETQQRLSQRGKGKGKKGKGKGNAKTFGSVESYPGFGKGKGGGYLEHRCNYKQAELGVAMTNHGWQDKAPDIPCLKSNRGPDATSANK